MQTLYVVQYMSLNAVQSAVEQRQTAQYGWSVVKQATLQQFYSVSSCYRGRTSCLIIEKYKMLLCTVRIIITYCVFFLFFLFESESPAAKEEEELFLE